MPAYIARALYNVSRIVSSGQPDPGELILTLSYSGSDTVGIILSLRETSFLGDLTLSPDFLAFSNEGINRFFLSLPTSDEERLWGGGEQYTYLNLRGRDYPIWVREQGVFRDPDDPRYTILEATNPGSGGYYHTTYWPQASFLSSRKYYFEVSVCPVECCTSTRPSFRHCS